MRTVAVVLAGGSDRRLGAAKPKQLGLLAGRTLIEHCVQAFDAAPAVAEVIVVAAPDIQDDVRRGTAAYRKVSAVIPAGASRTDSTRQALGWLRGQAAPADSKVLFHDAVRPLVDQRTIADCVAALDDWQAVSVVVPSADTVVEVTGGAITRVLPREELARCQTPQGFRLSVISRAYELAGADPGFAAVPATDECGVVLRYLPEVPIGIVQGSERNLKITHAADLAVAHALAEWPEPND